MFQEVAVLDDYVVGVEDSGYLVTVGRDESVLCPVALCHYDGRAVRMHDAHHDSLSEGTLCGILMVDGLLEDDQIFFGEFGAFQLLHVLDCRQRGDSVRH